MIGCYELMAIMAVAHSTSYSYLFLLSQIHDFERHIGKYYSSSLKVPKIPEKKKDKTQY